MTLNINDTYQLGATVLPADTTDIRQWFDTSKNGVISIDKQGNVIALKVGTAKVTVYEGSYLDTVTYNVKRVSTVTVIDPDAEVEEPKPVEIKATDFEFNGTSSKLKIGEKLQLTSVVTPVNTTDKLTYTTNNSNNVATVSDTGLVTVVGAGEAWICGTINGMKSYFIIE